MKTLRNKVTAITIAIFFTLSMTASITLIPSANAHTPAWQIPTYSYCNVSPNPIGVGQIARVNFWVNMPPPTASAQYGDRWMGMKVKVTLPDGTTTTLGPFTSDDTGGTVTTYTPTQTGNYTFQMTFPGQTLAGNNMPPGYNPASYPNIGDYYEPSSSNVFTLTVQQQPVGYPPVTPLPTNYWTRPIYAENSNWYSIAGNWLGFGQVFGGTTGEYNESGDYNPYTTAPNTAHILWTKPLAFGGTIGGEFGGNEYSNWYSTSQYEAKFAPIIMNGILYYTMYPGSSSNPAGWVAVNLNTGQTIWTKNTTEILVCGQIFNEKTPNQFGALGYLWSEPISQFGSLEMWDAMTGNYILSISGTPPLFSSILTEDDHGDLILYYINSTDNTLNMWNSTACINLSVPNSAGGPPVANNWMWRPPLDAVIDFSLGTEWSTPVATTYHGVPIADYADGFYGLAIIGVDSGVVLMDSTQDSAFWYETGSTIQAGYSTVTGALLWITNRTGTAYSLLIAGGNGYWYYYTMGNGVYLMITQSALSVSGYSLTTGQQVWGPETLPNANPFDALGMGTIAANGTMYLYGYGGDIYAINMASGTFLWHYKTPSGGYESPYGVEPLWVFATATVADGKLFVAEGHEYQGPLFHKAQQLALNITDGSPLWSIDAFDTTCGPAISDGVMTTLNAYDNQIYAYGMGPSKTTATVQAFGSSVVISGSVTDISAGSQQNAVAANFPNGLPCVSDASMSQFMEAVYMQQPMPTNLTGVPVILSVTDSNGNHYNIGTATTNAMGDYGLTWTPIIPGNFTVTATFAGTQSYYGSSATTYFYASPAAPTPAPTAPPITGLASTGTVMLGVAVVVIVIIICVAVLAVLMLRKRP